MEQGFAVYGVVKADDSGNLIREALAAYGPADGAKDALRVGFRKVRAEDAFNQACWIAWKEAGGGLNRVPQQAAYPRVSVPDVGLEDFGVTTHKLLGANHEACYVGRRPIVRSADVARTSVVDVIAKGLNCPCHAFFVALSGNCALWAQEELYGLLDCCIVDGVCLNAERWWGELPRVLQVRPTGV